MLFFIIIGLILVGLHAVEWEPPAFLLGIMLGVLVWVLCQVLSPTKVLSTQHRCTPVYSLTPGAFKIATDGALIHYRTSPQMPVTERVKAEGLIILTDSPTPGVAYITQTHQVLKDSHPMVIPSWLACTRTLPGPRVLHTPQGATLEVLPGVTK